MTDFYNEGRIYEWYADNDYKFIDDTNILEEDSYIQLRAFYRMWNFVSQLERLYKSMTHTILVRPKNERIRDQTLQQFNRDVRN